MVSASNIGSLFVCSYYIQGNYRIGGGIDHKYIITIFLIVILKTNILLIPNIPELVKQICNKIDFSHLSYLGYVILGYILSLKKFGKKYLLITPVLYFFTTVMTAYTNFLYSCKLGEKTVWLSGTFSAPVFIQACCIYIFFQCFKNLEVSHSEKLIYISECTFGIYLLHPMFLEFYGRHNFSLSSFHPIKSVLFVYAAVIAGSFTVTVVLKRIPLIRKII